jgi:hypothetical protein
MKRVTALFPLIVLFLFVVSCKDDENNTDTGQITFHFEEFVDFSPLMTDSMKYKNEAGNEYLVTEVQYFISNLQIHYQDGETYTVTQDDGIHYIDSDIPETHTWQIQEKVPAGTIDSISFTFGLDEEDNISNRFVNPPQSLMFWPDELGGGYHYMKLNLKYLTTNNEIMPFNYHMGIGQLYDTTGQVTEFVQNYFRVNCYLALYSSFIAQIRGGESNHLAIRMDINSWFKTPNGWDFNNFGMMMMQNQAAQQAAKENGFDVFAIGPYLEPGNE